MTYSTSMVHLELGRSNAKLLQVAGALAERFRAGVIGIAARQTRRAAADARPLLKQATNVSVVELAAEDDMKDDEKRVGRVLARRQQPVGGPALPLRQPLAARAAGDGPHQAAGGRPLGRGAGAELHLFT